MARVHRPNIVTPAGIYIPPSFGQFWQPKLAAARAGTGKAVLACVGDSVTVGSYASNPRTKSWTGLLRIALQAAYGDGGSGYRSTMLAPSGLVAQGVASATRTAWAALTDILYTETGSWTGSTGTGPGGFDVHSSTNGSTLTVKGTGTTISVYYPTNTTLGSFSWTIDGVSQGSVSENGTAGNAKVTATGLSAGQHTVVITTTSTSATYINGVAFENSTGVVVNNFGVWGQQSSLFNNTGTFKSGAWSGGNQYPADLVIYSMGLNDPASSVTGDAWAKNVRQYLEDVKSVNVGGGSANNGATDIILLLQHPGKFDRTNYLYQDYAARARGIAEYYGAALVDMGTLGRNSWEYWNSLGYWGDSSNPGAGGTDNVHLSDIGNQFVADTLTPLLVATS